MFQCRCFCSYTLISFEKLLCPLSSEYLRKNLNYSLSSPFSYCISSGLLHFLPSRKILLVFRYKFLLQFIFLIHSSFHSPFKSKSKEKVELVVRILCSLYALSCESKRLCSLGTKAGCTVQY